MKTQTNIHTDMKKEYIRPAIECVEIQNTQMFASSSFDTQSIGIDYDDDVDDSWT